MTAQLGNIALWIGLALALYGAAAMVVGHRRKSSVLIESGYSAVLAHGALVTIALLTLEYALITSDFSACSGSRVKSREFTVDKISNFGIVRSSVIGYRVLSSQLSTLNADFGHRSSVIGHRGERLQ